MSRNPDGHFPPPDLEITTLLLRRDNSLSIHLCVLYNAWCTQIDQLVASGYVYTQKGVQNITYNSIATDAVDEDDVLLDTDDLYKEYYLRGYNYRGIFQSLIEANMSGWYIFLLLYHVYY